MQKIGISANSPVTKITCSELLGSIDFAILTIRDDEFAAVLKFFPPSQRATGGLRTYEIALLRTNSDNVYKVALLKSHEQGHSAAQSATNDVLTDLRPQWIVLVGIAGAVPEYEFSLGDVVVATRLYDFSLTAATPDGNTELAGHGAPMHKVIQDTASRLQALKPELQTWNTESTLELALPSVSFEPNNFVGDIHWNEKLANTLKHRFVDSPRLPLVTAAPIVSANKLMKDPALLQKWLPHARDLKAVEMELPGVYAAARNIQGDTPVLAIRGISDIVGFKRAPTWTAYACTTAASFAHALLRTNPITPRRSAATQSAESDTAVDEMDVAQGEIKVTLADRDAGARRKGINRLIVKYDSMHPKTLTLMLVLSRLRREQAREARTDKSAAAAWDKAMESVITANSLPTKSDREKHDVLHLFAEYAVDYAQAGRNIGIELNQLFKSLNNADKELGQVIFAMSTDLSNDSTKTRVALLRAQRSKLNRALSTLLQLRGGPGSQRRQVSSIESHRAKSLRYAEVAVKSSGDQRCRLEWALSRIANAKSNDDPLALAAMSALRDLAVNEHSLPAGYELCRQLNFRHRYCEVVDIFPKLFAADKTTRRAYENVHEFAWAVKGLSDSSNTVEVTKQHTPEAAMKAMVWLDECVKFQFHTARDKVLLAYMRSILGLPIDKSMSALSGLHPQGGGVLEELSALSAAATENVVDGLLLGLGDAKVWSLIGTYLKTWTPHQDLAVSFYEQARSLSPKDPMFPFNKALILADMSKWNEADISLDECMAKSGNRLLWYQANKPNVLSLRTRIDAGLNLMAIPREPENK